MSAQSACAAYVQGLAAACPSAFLRSPRVAGFYADCAGNLADLAKRGQPCALAELVPPNGGAGSCNHTADLVVLNSGESCQLACPTDQCASLPPPQTPRS